MMTFFHTESQTRLTVCVRTKLLLIQVPRNGESILCNKKWFQCRRHLLEIILEAVNVREWGQILLFKRFKN